MTGQIRRVSGRTRRRVVGTRPVVGTRRPVIVEERREPFLRTLGTAGVAAGAGAVVEYLLDPDRGRARRARVRDKATHSVHEFRNGVEVLSRDLSNRGRGVVASARYRLAGSVVDDRVLHDRVRAELGRHVSHPHAVEVHVENGVVTLTGDVLAEEAQPAQRAMQRVPGVEQVQPRWTVHEDATGVPALQGEARPREPIPELLQQYWSPSMRFVAGMAALAMVGIAGRLPRPLSWALGGAGAVLAARAATNLPLKRLTGIAAGRHAIEVEDAISVATPPEMVWPLVRDYSLFPQLMPDVREVRLSEGGRRSHWVISGPAGIPVRFDAEETKREEGREIAWKTTEGQLIAHAGTLRLDPEGDRGTRVQVKLTYNPVVGGVGHAVATLLRADPRHKLHEDLQRLKSFMETGKPPHDAAQPVR